MVVAKKLNVRRRMGAESRKRFVKHCHQWSFSKTQEKCVKSHNPNANSGAASTELDSVQHFVAFPLWCAECKS